MTGGLHDPTLPPGAIVAKLEDDRVRRNDGEVLEPASRNPWYVLATIAGEQTDADVDWELHARNRRYWNGWACAGMNAEERDALADRMGLTDADLKDLEEEEWTEIEQEFADRLPEAEIPDPTAPIHLSYTHFSGWAVWEKCVFRSIAWFDHATFSGTALFRHATFSDDAWFENATFSYVAIFIQTTFSESGIFSNATFSGYAYFDSSSFSDYGKFDGATFSSFVAFKHATVSNSAFFDQATFFGTALFDHATFSKSVVFDRARFSSSAYFQSVQFGGETRFRDARFLKQVPLFFSATLYQNTSFTTEPSHWPKITGATDLDIAEDGKAAYSRLRQMMSELHRPDDEHFFLRQEMDCARFIEPRNRRIWITLFRWFSDYGYGVWRPILWLLGFWISGALYFVARFEWRRHFYDGAEQIANGFGLSFANTFTIFGFRGLYYEEGYFAGLPTDIQIVGAAQTILGFVFLFFLGLGLRNRFRLR